MYLHTGKLQQYNQLSVSATGEFSQKITRCNKSAYQGSVQSNLIVTSGVSEPLNFKNQYAQLMPDAVSHFSELLIKKCWLGSSGRLLFRVVNSSFYRDTKCLIWLNCNFEWNHMQVQAWSNCFKWAYLTGSAGEESEHRHADQVNSSKPCTRDS